MVVAPIPVFALFFFVGLGEFVFVAMVFGQEAVPGLVS
jgi:hypothetical protein